MRTAQAVAEYAPQRQTEQGELMFESLVIAAVMALPADIDEREWSVNRPSRSTHASAFERAATIPPQWRAFASCVIHRESGGSLDDHTSGMGARNGGSSASGRWQFLDTKWRVNGGIEYIVSRRLKTFGVPAPVRADIREFLHTTHISDWPGLYQDAAFAQVVLEGGAHHWNGPGC